MLFRSAKAPEDLEELRHVAIRTFDSWTFRQLRLLGNAPGDLLRESHDANIERLVADDTDNLERVDVAPAKLICIFHFGLLTCPGSCRASKISFDPEPIYHNGEVRENFFYSKAQGEYISICWNSDIT